MTQALAWVIIIGAAALLWVWIVATICRLSLEVRRRRADAARFREAMRPVDDAVQDTTEGRDHGRL